MLAVLFITCIIAKIAFNGFANAFKTSHYVVSAMWDTSFFYDYRDIYLNVWQLVVRMWQGYAADRINDFLEHTSKRQQLMALSCFLFRIRYRYVCEVRCVCGWRGRGGVWRWNICVLYSHCPSTPSGAGLRKKSHKSLSVVVSRILCCVYINNTQLPMRLSTVCSGCCMQR